MSLHELIVTVVKKLFEAKHDVYNDLNLHKYLYIFPNMIRYFVEDLKKIVNENGDFHERYQLNNIVDVIYFIDNSCNTKNIKNDLKILKNATIAYTGVISKNIKKKLIEYCWSFFSIYTTDHHQHSYTFSFDETKIYFKKLFVVRITNVYIKLNKNENAKDTFDKINKIMKINHVFNETNDFSLYNHKIDNIRDEKDINEANDAIIKIEKLLNSINCDY